MPDFVKHKFSEDKTAAVGTPEERHPKLWKKHITTSNKAVCTHQSNVELPYGIPQQLAEVWNNYRSLDWLCLPVSILSLTIAFPDTKTASQAITQPLAGIIITSPGTKCVVSTSTVSKYR